MSYLSVGVYVGAGSRQDTLETTGSAYLLTKMLSRGTGSQSKASFNDEIEGMGGSMESQVDREQTSITMKVMKGDVSRAVGLLGDAVSSATLDPAELELTKQEVAAEHETNHTDYEGTTLQ